MSDGFGDRDPLMEHTDDRGDYDDDDGDTTGTFELGSASTPGPSGEQMSMPTRTTTMNRQRGSDTAETSFIEGDTGSRTTFDSLKIQVANETLSQKYPNYRKDGKILTLKVSKKKYPGRVVVIGTIGGKTPLFKADSETINPKLPKTVTETLGPERQVLIHQKDEEIEKIDKNIREEQEIANNENEGSAVRERAREKIQEKIERRDALVNERENLKRKLSFPERIKEIFKKYGVTPTAILIAAGVTIGSVIGVITKALTSTGIALGNWLKSIGKALKDRLEKTGKDLGNGLKEIGKKIASILPGLLGSIVSFLFKTVGQAIGFLAEHTWLLILAVVAFLIESFIKKQR